MGLWCSKKKNFFLLSFFSKTALLRCWATENQKWRHKQKLATHECPKNRQNR